MGQAKLRGSRDERIALASAKPDRQPTRTFVHPAIADQRRVFFAALSTIQGAFNRAKRL